MRIHTTMWVQQIHLDAILILIVHHWSAGVFTTLCKLISIHTALATKFVIIMVTASTNHHTEIVYSRLLEVDMHIISSLQLLLGILLEHILGHILQLLGFVHTQITIALGLPGTDTHRLHRNFGTATTNQQI